MPDDTEGGHVLQANFRYKEPTAFLVQRCLAWNGRYWRSPEALLIMIDPERDPDDSLWSWITTPLPRPPPGPRPAPDARPALPEPGYLCVTEAPGEELPVEDQEYDNVMGFVVLE